MSFHFGLPSDERIRALREAGIVLLATATSMAEGRAAAKAGMHAVVAQGYEAGGHRVYSIRMRRMTVSRPWR